MPSQYSSATLAALSREALSAAARLASTPFSSRWEMANSSLRKVQVKSSDAFLAWATLAPRLRLEHERVVAVEVGLRALV